MQLKCIKCGYTTNDEIEKVEKKDVYYRDKPTGTYVQICKKCRGIMDDAA